jgi:hypothetical protein
MIEMADELTGMYELLDALEAVLKAAPKAERDALAATINAYAEDFPDDYFWAVSAQSPTLLYHLMNAIELAATDDGEKKGRVIRLVHRKPEGI